MGKISYLTPEGLKKLKDELYRMENVERPAISKQIGEAIDKGDISENAEYDAAKDAQGMLEMKIAKLKDIIVNARLIDASKIDTSKVQLLSKVKIKNTRNNAEMQYIIVSDSEADLKSGKLAVNTPVAQGLLGKKVGDVVEIKVPSGVIPFEIVEITSA
ncbi:MAG: transcription elongation factor GreA [Bacteroidetes bacterium]|nr:MAG: transcription elongation factor GreA [Bacteroidota bacterium]